MSMTSTPLWTICHAGLKYPLLTTCVVGGYLYVVQPSPVVAITFDDGRKSVYTLALPYMESKDMVGTVYINNTTIGQESHMTVEDLNKFVSNGWEVGSHGYDHSDMTTLDRVILNDSFVNSIAGINSMIGKEPTSVASPFGNFNDTVIAVIDDHFSYHVNAWSEANGINTSENFNPLNFHRLDTANVTAEYVCEVVENLNNGEVFSIIFHEITDVEGKWNITYSEFKSIIDCIEDSGVDVKTVTEAARTLE